jgi:hypothetical protein
MEKIMKTNQKFGKIGRTINQAPTPRPKHDRIWAQWVLDIPPKNMLKGYDGVDVLRWNHETKPFVAWWVVQTWKDMCELGVIRDHLLFWGVARKGRCYCQLMLRLQEGKDVDQS